MHVQEEACRRVEGVEGEGEGVKARVEREREAKGGERAPAQTGRERVEGQGEALREWKGGGGGREEPGTQVRVEGEGRTEKGAEKESGE